MAEENKKNRDRLLDTIIKDRYKIHKKIASGGMSDVYMGMDQKLKKKVAVKILHESYADNRIFTARFKSEAEILTSLKSPNIVSIYDWGRFENLHFIIMEFVSGRSLKEIIESKGSLDPILAAEYSIQICKALQLAHNNNLIHRDIKPQNIMITDKDIVKVTDFGIAKSTAIDITKTISVLGTAQYISPQQAQGKILDNRTDIYSLGIVMYEMLSSDIPFRGGSSIDISLRHINEKPQPPSDIFPEIPEKFEKIVMKCLEKKPDDRYQDISVLKEDLQNFLDDKPLIIEHRQKNNLKKKLFHPAYYQYTEQFGRDFKKFQLKIKRITLGLVLSLSVAVIGFIVFLTLFLISDSKIETLTGKLNKVTVPGLQNMEYESAKEILLDYGLVIEIKNRKYHELIPQDYIISQDITQGTRLEKDSTIYVILSKGKENAVISVPNLLGISKEGALKQLGISGLEEGKISLEFDSSAKKGTVIKQDPAPGSTAWQNTEVDLTISNGRQLINIPDIKGYDYITAKNYLESLGLIVNTELKTSNFTRPGIVLSIEPIEGSAVNKNSNVTIFISTEVQLIEVPRLLNMDYEIAQNVLNSYDIDFEVNYVKVEKHSQANTVIAQYPEPEENISLQESIILFVGKL